MPADHASRYEQRDAVQSRSDLPMREGKRSSQGGRRRDEKRRTATATRSDPLRRYPLGTALTISPPAGVLSLSPLLCNLPSLSGMSAFKGYLPQSVTSRKVSASSPPQHQGYSGERLSYARWQLVDMQDGKGESSVLITSSRSHTLRIFRQPPSRLPDDPDAKEEHCAAEEIVSIPTLRLDQAAEVLSALVEADNDGTRADMVTTRRPDLHGYEIAQADVVASGGRLTAVILLQTIDRALDSSAVAKLDLMSGMVIAWREIRSGSKATMRTGSRAIIVTTSDPSHIHLLDTASLRSIPLASIAPSSFPARPVVATSGRLIAYTTAEEPRSLGRDGLGTLIASRRRVSPRRSAPSEAMLFGRSLQGVQSSSHPHAPLISSATILSSAAAAAGYGGMAARGLAAGLRKGAQMANEARPGAAGRLARSAPVERSLLVDPDEDEDEQGTRRGRDEQVEVEEVVEQPRRASQPFSKGSTENKHKRIVRWIKIVDLTRDRVIAHFQLPPANAVGAMLSPHVQTEQAVSYLSFNPDGTQLLAAQSDGRACHVFQIHPAAAAMAATENARDVHGEVYHMYELKRGNTPADIKDVVWDPRGRWVGIVSGQGTIHVYPIHPSGAIPSSASQLSCRLGNPSNIAQLSTPVSAVARLRSNDPAHPETVNHLAASVLFTSYREDILRPGRFLQDVAVCRPEQGIIESVRLTISKRKPDESRLNASHHVGDLAVDNRVNARWYLPESADEVQLVRAKRSSKRAAAVPLAHAEIRTYSIDLRVLPKSIYLSNQFAFQSARAIDEFSPLSIMDAEARRRRLVFRAEIAPRSDQVSASFSDPLSTALETAIPSPSHRPIPGLPNGQPGSWGSSLSRQVAHGVGEGVERMKEHYAHARAQAARRQRQAGEALSFDEGAVFPTVRAAGEEDVSEEEPLPGLLSDRSGSASGSTASHEHDKDRIGTSPVESGWGDRDSFEREYDAAVRDEEPDDLILGVMDELGEVRDVRQTGDVRDLRGGRDERGWAEPVYSHTQAKGKDRSKRR